MGILIRLVVKAGASVGRFDLSDPAHPVHDVVKWIIGG